MTTACSGSAGVLPAPPADPLVLHLPYPPTVNHLYRNVRGRGRVKSREGIAYASAVALIVRREAILRGLPLPWFPAKAWIRATWAVRLPDARARDLDNLKKAVHDSLTAAGVWPDDHRVVVHDTLPIIDRAQPGLTLTLAVEAP